jgi:hypothetical protein
MSPVMFYIYGTHMLLLNRAQANKYPNPNDAQNWASDPSGCSLTQRFVADPAVGC